VLNGARGLPEWAHRHHRLVVAGALVALWLGVGGALALWFSGRIRDWSVMTDELLYAKLATSISETGSPLPQVHGATIEVYNQLYPLLLAPLYGALSAPDAFRAAHVLNAFVMASAAFPAYLLGREILSRRSAFAVAALSVVVPWMVLTSFLMTEAAAYPAFLWALLGLQRAISRPSPRGDLLAVAALGLAVFARTQFAVLVLVLPLAILAHEIGRALVAAGDGGIGRRALDGARESVHRHRLLAALYAVGGVLAIAVTVAGSLGDLLGVYAVTVEGSILPSDAWSAAARHLDAVAIGCGLVPLVLGAGWMLSAVARPRAEREHALATLSLVTLVLLVLEAGSFGVRFGGTTLVRDRYVFYVVPLLLIGTAAALTRAPRRPVAIGAAVVTVFFASTVWLLPFTTFTGVWVDSPASVLNELLIEQSGSLGTGAFVAILGLLVGLVLVLCLLLVPRGPLALVVLAALVAFSLLTLRSEVDRVRSGTSLAGRPLAADSGLVLDWVDSVLPEGATAAVVPFPVSTAWDTTAIRWWDVELWNHGVVQAFVAADGNFRYTGFPVGTLEVDRATGEIAGTSDAPPYVVGAPADSRFGLAGRFHATNVGLVVRRVERPYRALWVSQGLQPDGWTSPGAPATIRVFGPTGGGPRIVRVVISSRPPDGEARKSVSFVCIAPGSFADVAVDAAGAASIAGVQLGPGVTSMRRVGELVGPVAVAVTRRSCAPR
jgi:hypothetical protein